MKQLESQAPGGDQDRTACMVTTAHRGIFFGYKAGDVAITDGSSSIRLRNARSCVYWTADLRGFLGLASHGPNEGCRIGPSVEEILLIGVTSVSAVSEQARLAWEAAPWSL